MRTVLVALLLTVCLASPLSAQSINVAFGSSGGAPADSYAAAGEAGFWNHIPGTQGTTYTLKTTAGLPSSVTLLNIGGSQIQAVDHPGTVGNDERLLDEYLVTFTPTLETCLFFNGLEPGEYRVTTYAWLPGEPMLDSYVTVDFADQGGILVGGEWPGSLQEGIVYSIHTVEVTSNGSLASHSGIPVGSTPIAALNGVQLELLGNDDFVRGDVNADGNLDILDPIALLGILFLGQEPLPCDDALDVDDDGQLTLVDATQELVFLFAQGSPPQLPHPACGPDPTGDDLACAQFAACP